MTRSQSTKVTCACEACGREFLVFPSQKANGQGRFCSRACRWAPRPLLPHPTIPDCLIVPLTRGQQALIDATDAPLIAPYTWSAGWSGKAWYARRMDHATGKHVLMHRAILGLDGELEGDHVNGDGLDNRRSNLRAATRNENQRNRRRQSNNRSGYKGVIAWRGRWVAVVKLPDRQVRFGPFDDPREAALAYDANARELFGEFAQLNFPPD